MNAISAKKIDLTFRVIVVVALFPPPTRRREREREKVWIRKFIEKPLIVDFLLFCRRRRRRRRPGVFSERRADDASYSGKMTTAFYLEHYLDSKLDVLKSTRERQRKQRVVRLMSQGGKVIGLGVWQRVCIGGQQLS